MNKLVLKVGMLIVYDQPNKLWSTRSNKGVGNGFHTYDYARHYFIVCTRILGLEGTPNGVEDQGKLTCVVAFPFGIDSERFIQTLELPEVQDHMKELKERFAGRKEPLKQLSDDPKTTLVVLSGSARDVLDKHVFEYFAERTPRFHFELRETSVIWNYKYAGFKQEIYYSIYGQGQYQMHLLILSKALDLLRSGQLVSQRIYNIDCCLNVNLDEDVYNFFKPELPSESAPTAGTLLSSSHRPSSLPKSSSTRSVSGSKAFRYKKQLYYPVIYFNGGTGLFQGSWFIG
ncbi:hypothetical protein TanjilG_20386 [Lupinus angustifolius]|uniref:Uncharacterized protein n=1 Tax=Lupinus angustifolius TaxID=3871 RepID=A0A4P1RWC5_LUPAN|nr:hypothetical protein TanjilG_20386 [Lupinus angustifolius]